MTGITLLIAMMLSGLIVMAITVVVADAVLTRREVKKYGRRISK